MVDSCQIRDILLVSSTQRQLLDRARSANLGSNLYGSFVVEFSVEVL